jgi:tetratricopeptide (TPR) repeat protein
METVEVLRLRQVLEDAEGGRLRFVHDKLREAAYARLPEEGARALHHRAAETLEARSAAAPDLARHAPSLGHHWARAKVHDRAGLWLSRAAERARAAYATNEALGFYRSALDELRQLPPEGHGEAVRETEARAHEGLGELLALTGRHEEARSAFTEALARAPQSQRLARARVHLGMGRSWEAQHQQAEALHALDAAEAALGPALEEGSDPRWWHVWVEVQIERVSVHYWRARTDEGAALLQRVRPIVEARGTPLQRARFFRALFQTQVRRERYRFTPEMMGNVRAYLAGCEEAGDEVEACVARSGLAIALVVSNALDEAEGHLRVILRLAERMEDAMLRARGLGYLALLHRMRGQPEETRRTGAQALAVAEAGKMLDYTGLARANLAWVDWREGRTAEAEQGFRAALLPWQPPAYVFPFQWVALLPLLRMALERNHLEEAVGHARALLDVRLQRLPEDVARPLELACEVWGRANAPQVREALEQALVSAQVHGLQ